MTCDSLLISEGFAVFFGANEKATRNASRNIQSPSLYKGIATPFWTHKGQRACQTIVSRHFTIGWKLTSTHYFIAAQLCLVLIILAQELLFFCSREYIRNSCVPFKLSRWRSAISRGGHMHLVARGTNESEKIHKNSTEQRNPSRWWGSAANPTFSSTGCYFGKLSPSKTTALLRKVFCIFSCLLKAKSIQGGIRCSRKPSASVQRAVSFWLAKLSS